MIMSLGFILYFFGPKKKTLCNRAKGDEENAVYIFMELDVKKLAERERGRNEMKREIKHSTAI